MGLPISFDDPGNGVGFAGARGPQQGLVAVPVVNEFSQLLNRLGLVPRGFEGCLNVEVAHCRRSPIAIVSFAKGQCRL